MKNNTGLEEMVQALIVNNTKHWKIIHDYHFGGYAKHRPALFGFMNEFYKRTKIPTDFVYTGKLFFAVSDLIDQNYFPTGSRLLLIHSGGLQGNKSLSPGSLIF
jgi:1-aminocyclopropane-1-carboxylate deaminase